jgi:hypothetical protein
MKSDIDQIADENNLLERQAKNLTTLEDDLIIFLVI